MKIFSWGSNSHGQLGQGTDAEQILFPIPIDIAVEPKIITGGGKHTILLTSNGEIFSSGDNDKGQLGTELTTKLVNIFKHISFNLKVNKVSCGWDFNLVLTENHQVYAWGSNSYGQLGLCVEKVKCLSTPHKVFENKVLDIGAGLRHSAIVTSDGLIFTSGYGRKGQLGISLNGTIPSIIDKFTLRYQVTMHLAMCIVSVKDLKDCQEISCGECHCIAKTKGGNVYSWGNNKYGQLGFNPDSITSSAHPIQIELSTKITGRSLLFSGWAHNAILTDKGQIINWGRNDFGQLGEKRLLNWKPELLKNLINIKQVCLGSHHSMVLTENGEVFTWGWNEHGNCGNSNCDNVLQPYKLSDFFRVKLIGSGAAHCFLLLLNKMNSATNILEIESPNVEPIANEILTNIPVIQSGVEYSEFFHQYLLPNWPCIIKNAYKDWPCIKKWIKNKSLNVEYFRNNLENIKVPISNCEKREFNVQKKCSIKLHDYLDYWEEYKKCSNKMDCLYLKDWHFMKDFPHEEVYRVPSYFASDWLNEYYDKNPLLNDDYRFVYIGPKGSWTPFHADVFNSYSWSVNICGRKKWILFPPGAEGSLRDSLGNLSYTIESSKLTNEERSEINSSFEVIQEEGQGLFVPSGWHHQVWNLEDTISINHNWINGCNIHKIWTSLQNNLSDVMKEISDCKEMENWVSQCQLVLSASFGINYQFFYNFLEETAKCRINALKTNKNLNVYGNWSFGKNHLKFDLRQILKILHWLEKDDNFLAIASTESNLNHALEFMDSLAAFLNSDCSTIVFFILGPRTLRSALSDQST